MKPVTNFAGDAVLSAIAAATGRGLSLLGMVATTRIFPAEIYGAWLLILTFSNFFLPLATLRMEIPLVMARTQRMVKGLCYVVAMCVLAVLIFVLAFAAFANATLVERVTGLTVHQSTLLLFSIPTVLLLTSQLLVQTALMRTKQFRAIAVINLVIPFLSLILTLVLPLIFAVTPQLAAIIFLASTGFGLATAVPALAGRIATLESMFSRWAMARAAFRQYSVYPKYTLPLSLSASVTERVTQLVLAQAYSLETLASFYMARQVLSGFTSVLAGSLRNVFFAHSARDQNVNGTRDRALRMLKLLTYLLAPVLAFAVFRIDDLVSSVVGARWPNLGAMAWFCMFPATFLVFTGPLDRVFDLVGRQRLSVALQLVSDAIMLITIALAVHFSATSTTLVGLISTVLVLYNATWLCFTLNSLAVPTSQIARFFIRFVFVFSLCMMIQWTAVSQGSKTLSWVASIVLLGVAIIPGIAAFSSSFAFFHKRISPGLVNSLQRLP